MPQLTINMDQKKRKKDVEPLVPLQVWSKWSKRKTCEVVARPRTFKTVFSVLHIEVHVLDWDEYHIL